MKKQLITLFIAVLSISLFAQSTQSGREYRRYNILNKNLVKTVFSNGGVIGHPVDRGPRGAWIEDSNGYVGDVSPFVGCEIPYKVSADSTFYFHSVTYCLADRRPNTQERNQATGEFWGFEPIKGYFNASLGADQAAVAVYTVPLTWPSTWPDRSGDATDPGWAGQWNGYFGKGISNATEETYFAMNDSKDEEFNVSTYNNYGIAFLPDSTNSLVRGMGLEVKVRGLQWKQFLAQDCIFWLYEITNKGKTNYNKATFGMLVGTYIGVTGQEGDHREYDDDWSFFDAELDITYTGDFPDDNQRNPLWQGPVGMVGYAFLESPGNPFDGIDNDNDGDENVTLAPRFNQSDFDSVEIDFGTDVVLIDENFNRTIVKINSDTVVKSLGKSFTLKPGKTKLIEGNTYLGPRNRLFVNANANDGYDNDLDGVIDENFFLHYWQRRQDEDGNFLINVLRPIRYKNYLTGQGVNDLMVDESRTDEIDNDNDWNSATDDVGMDGVAKTFDEGESDGLPTSGAARGLPGEPNIDITDVDESDQIGLTSFDYFTNVDVEADVLTNDQAWWNRVAPGQFDVPSSIVENEPIEGEDGDFFYASGYFPLLAGNTERFSLALVYGGGRGGRSSDLADLLKNRETVQKIYDSNYQFPKEPDTPTLTATAGDGKVILTWDRIAEKSFDPVLKEFDFEGYRLYKSSEPDLSDIFIVTDADGKIRGYQELEQWDLRNDISGYFQGTQDLTNNASGFTWNLGSNTGLQHSYVDEDVINGRRYFYVITAYDRGDPARDIFPAESPFILTEDFTTGEIKTGKNAAVIIPGTNVPGYVEPDASGMLSHTAGPGSGNIYYKVIDPKSTKEAVYIVEFFDSSNDGLDNDGDWDPILGHDLNGNGEPDSNEPNVDLNDPDEYWPKTSQYSVKDMTVYTENIRVVDSLFIDFQRKNLVEGSVIVKNSSGQTVADSLYTIDYTRGRFRPVFEGVPVPIQIGNEFSIDYEYYPVFRSAYVGELNDDLDEGYLFDSDNFDGVQLSFLNDFKIELNDSATGWSTEDGYDVSIGSEDIDLDGDTQPDIYANSTPHNILIEFDSVAIDTSSNLFFSPELPVNFKLTNETIESKLEYIYVPVHGPNTKGFYELEPGDFIYIFEKGPKDSLYFTWQIFIKSSNDVMRFTKGDYFRMVTTKPFRKGDVFTFASEPPEVDETLAANTLKNVRVVPNPYIVGHIGEPKAQSGLQSGRGQRIIYFTNIPDKSKVYIFTSRGELVRKLEAESINFSGNVTWDLKNKDGLDVAFGVYFYVVDSPVGKKRGKIGIIK